MGFGASVGGVGGNSKFRFSLIGMLGMVAATQSRTRLLTLVFTLVVTLQSVIACQHKLHLPNRSGWVVVEYYTGHRQSGSCTNWCRRTETAPSGCVDRPFAPSPYQANTYANETNEVSNIGPRQQQQRQRKMCANISQQPHMRCVTLTSHRQSICAFAPHTHDKCTHIRLALGRRM